MTDSPYDQHKNACALARRQIIVMQERTMSAYEQGDFVESALEMAMGPVPRTDAGIQTMALVGQAKMDLDAAYVRLIAAKKALDEYQNGF